MIAPAERLGSFYLGAEYDLKTGHLLETAVNYDARDLTTHAVCVGMTGSGKTGLCVGLLEEAAIDKVPAIVIDPKGDITNLLLQFPQLRPEDFEPWVNIDDARRQGKTVSEYAQTTAEQWRAGLAGWGIGPDRIRLLKDAADFTIYTPGSDAGVPINILGSLAAPALDFEDNVEAIRERISGTVLALLGLIGLKADPINSREAILLANIFEHFWRQQQDLDLTKLIMSIQNPPVRQIGVFEVNTFFPQKERFELAMAFNNLIASPNFKSWLEGEALDVDRLLYTADGQPRHSIFYIAHLSDSERMFFVTLLLENVLTWVRRQAGTTSLRALLYFDEIFGFMPPVAEPPSKRPLLTLLKQARAFGLGCVLVTQNPVDLDYKGLTNAGTWFIGKLQAGRDKERVLQGLQSAISQAGGQAQVNFDTLIGQLSNRVFLLHNVHEDRPLILYTRWAMSYLRGPLAKPQIRQLMAHRKERSQSRPIKPISPETAKPAVQAAAIPASRPAASTPAGYSEHPPTLEPNVPQVYLPLELTAQAAIGALSQDLGRQIEVKQTRLIYEPAIIGGAEVRFVDHKRKLDEKVSKVLLAPPPDELSGVNWGEAESLTLTLDKLAARPAPTTGEHGPFFAPVPETANTAQELKNISTDLADWLFYDSRQTITVHPELGLFQEPNESTRAFRIRLQQAARENRDAEVDRLEAQYDKQFARWQDKLRRQERILAQDEAEHEARKREEMIGIGESVLGFFIGRRSTRTLSRAATRRRLTSQSKLDFEQTKEELAELQAEIKKLEEELKEQADEITRKWADLLDDLTTEEISPRRTDINVRLVALAWLPSWLISYNEGPVVQTATLPAYPLPPEA
ncbi:MAG: DUF87 domain-containing protein [Chloroflexota bacterium]